MKKLVVDRDAVKKNIAAVKKRAGRAEIYAVLKCNAYGCGLIEMARLMRNAGISRFAVDEVHDVRRLRDTGFIDEEILMLRSTSDIEEIEELLDCGAVFTVGSYEAGLALNGAAEKQGAIAEAHIKLDTGMGRYGFPASEFERIASIYRYFSNIAFCGIYTDLNSYSQKRIAEQLDLFSDAVSKIQQAGCETGIVHAANSVVLFQYDFSNLDAVCIGSAFFKKLKGKGGGQLLDPAYIETNVDELRWMPAGHTVGSLKVTKFKKPKKVALIPVGMYHGFFTPAADEPRERFNIRFGLKNLLSRKRSYVKMGGAKVPVLGDSDMMHTLIDVTKVNCVPGDKVQISVNPLFVKGMPIEYK